MPKFQCLFVLKQPWTCMPRSLGKKRKKNLYISKDVLQSFHFLHKYNLYLKCKYLSHYDCLLFKWCHLKSLLRLFHNCKIFSSVTDFPNLVSYLPKASLKSSRWIISKLWVFDIEFIFLIEFSEKSLMSSLICCSVAPYESERKKETSNLNSCPVDTGRKLNVHKMFNLRHVSTG